MVRSTAEMSNDVLLLLAAQGDHDARSERLAREIMLVDELEWPEATARVAEMAVAHGSVGGVLGAVKGLLGVSVSLAGLATVPMVFGHDTALWFNEHCVGFVPPPEAELQDWLEVGAWTWSWMEPPLGTVSFLILCFQATRDQLALESLLERRRVAQVLARHPRYDATILAHWVRSLPRAQDAAGQRTRVLRTAAGSGTV